MLKVTAEQRVRRRHFNYRRTRSTEARASIVDTRTEVDHIGQASSGTVADIVRDLGVRHRAVRVDTEEVTCTVQVVLEADNQVVGWYRLTCVQLNVRHTVELWVDVGAQSVQCSLVDAVLYNRYDFVHVSFVKRRSAVDDLRRGLGYRRYGLGLGLLNCLLFDNFNVQSNRQRCSRTAQGDGQSRSDRYTAQS
ncbi:hypothetical protein D3C80_754820 [compost metagenome]